MHHALVVRLACFRPILFRPARAWRSVLVLMIILTAPLGDLPAYAADTAQRVRDINTTGGIPNNSSSPRSLTLSGGTVFFSADDGIGGRELWRSNGTEIGAQQVEDISPGVASSSPGELTDLNGTLFFTATTVLSGTELWRSDGSSAGTAPLQDINPVPGASSHSGRPHCVKRRALL